MHSHSNAHIISAKITNAILERVESYSIKVNCILVKEWKLFALPLYVFLSLLHDSPQEFFCNFWSERLRRCLTSSKKRAISKKNIYISIDLSIPIGIVSDIGITGTMYFYNALCVVASLPPRVRYLFGDSRVIGRRRQPNFSRPRFRSSIVENSTWIEYRSVRTYATRLFASAA